MRNKIAAVYLARVAEPFKAIDAFIKSYIKHSSGVQHSLFILVKGEASPGYLAALDVLLSGYPYSILTVPESAGYDIHAYAYATQTIDYEYLCFFNTFSQIEADEWLKKLYDNLVQNGVGIAGATASYESLFNSYSLWQQFSWFNKNAYIPLALRKSLSFLMQHPSTGLRSSLKYALKCVARHKLPLKLVATECLQWWRKQISVENENSFIWDFPAFPNPHIRTNAFIIRRKDLLAHGFPTHKTKMDCCRFESGEHSLTASLRRKGLRPILVGANGKGYDLHEWADSGCFRSGAQHNLLVTDNHTRAFAAMSEAEKQAINVMTWGGYSANAPNDTSILGIPFSSKRDLSKEQIDLCTNSGESRLFSIVIPCHNRGDLAMQVVQMVLQQEYQNWEICVFDNASEDPLVDIFSPLNDSRITVKRSDDFLPVTESWNNAFAMASGDYVTMLGDDDGILPGFFSRLNALADSFDNPELIFSGMLQFMYPGVIQTEPAGYLVNLFMADFMEYESNPFILSREEADRSVSNSLAINRSFIFHMPAYTTSRRLLKKMMRGGKLMHSPFPDYYFANIALSLSEKTVCEPRALSFQGVSRASFGFNLLNNTQDNGFKTLGESAPDDIQTSCAAWILPGDRYQSKYITTMAYIADTLGRKNLKPNVNKYRRIQILNAKRNELHLIWRKLTFCERLWFLFVTALRYLDGRMRGCSTLLKLLQTSTSPYSTSIAAGVSWINKGSYCTGLEVAQDAEHTHFPNTLNKC